MGSKRMGEVKRRRGFEEKSMKKSLCLMFVLVLAALISFPIAFMQVDSQKESVTITEEVLAGEPTAAEGVTLQFLTHWNAHALWDTKYVIGSRKAETTFDFAEDEVNWVQEASKYLDINIPVNFGTATVVGVGSGAENGVDLEEMWIPELLKDVAERTKPGETHEEVVKLADYYKYYPLELSVLYEAGDMSFYSNGVDYFSDYFHIVIQENEELTVSITKNAEGLVTAVDCNGKGDGASINTAYAFGEAGCFFTYAFIDWETGQRINAGENTGIFYTPYITENRRFTLKPDQVGKVCQIPENIVPVQMLWNEEKGELYMAAEAGNAYRLYIYDVNGDKIALQKELAVLSKAQMPYWREMTLEDGGILMKWSDGTFSFVAENGGDYQLWCSNVFVPDLEYLGDMQIQANQAIEVGSTDTVFSYEHACAFDGERLVLACYDSWESVNVTLAVYNQEEQLYCGRYHHSAEADMYMNGLSRNIYAQGTVIGSNRRKLVDYEPLKVWVDSGCVD